MAKYYEIDSSDKSINPQPLWVALKGIFSLPSKEEYLALFTLGKEADRFVWRGEDGGRLPIYRCFTPANQPWKFHVHESLNVIDAYFFDSAAEAKRALERHHKMLARSLVRYCLARNETAPLGILADYPDLLEMEAS